MNLRNFLNKNQKYVTIALISLLLLKSFQSCNRSMTINKLNKEIVYTTDSLTNLIDSETGDLASQLAVAKDSIKTLNFEVRLAVSGQTEANKRAKAIQSTAEKVRKNTTIKIEQTVRDTSK